MWVIEIKNNTRLGIEVEIWKRSIWWVSLSVFHIELSGCQLSTTSVSTIMLHSAVQRIRNCTYLLLIAED